MRQKKSCLLHGLTACYAHESVGRVEFCVLGYQVEDYIPLEPCPKPRSYKEYEKLFRLGGKNRQGEK